MIDSILLFIEILGVVSFAVAGALVAIDKETDVFGVVFLSLMTCFGGGIIRDITIGRNPPAFFRDISYQVAIGTAVALIVFILASLFKKQYDNRITSRLIGSFRSLGFAGEDIRIKKTIMQNKK